MEASQVVALYVHKSIGISALDAASIEVANTMYTPFAGSDRIASTFQQELHLYLRGGKCTS
jgi:hypothetical protein